MSLLRSLALLLTIGALVAPAAAQTPKRGGI